MKKLIYLLLILFLQNLSHVEAQYSWNQKSDFIGFDRVFMAGFSTQNKGYVGGGVENQIGTPHKEFYEWSQQTNTWSQKADIPIPVYMGVAFSINGIGYLGSGATTGGTRITKFWKYTPSNDTWDTIADLPGAGRQWAVAFSINGFGYVGLGSSGSYGTKSFWKYDPVNNVWTPIADFGGSGRDKAVAFVIDSVAYVGTGQDSLVGGFRNDFWKYSPSTDSWTQVSSINTPRRNATAFSILDKGYVGTGNCICQPIRLKDFWEYNPISNQWTQIADCSSEIRQYAPAYSINNRGYVLTGVDTNGMVLNDNWEYGPPTLPLSANAVPTNPSCNSLCDGTATVVGSNGTPPYQYLWLTNNDTSATANNLCAGVHVVQVTDAFLETVYDTVTLTEPAPVQVSITADTTVICANDSAEICAPSGFASYLWNVGATSNCVTTNLAGNYYVTVTDNNGCTAVSNHLALNVRPLPPVSISVNGDTLTAYNAVTYQWFRNGLPINNATSSTYITKQLGSYSVAVTDSFGCMATSIPVVISGIEDLQENKISVYPNPIIDGSWQIEVGNNLVGSDILIYDANGKIIYKSVLKNTKSEIEFEAEKGIYLMRIVSKEHSCTQKLIRL